MTRSFVRLDSAALGGIPFEICRVTPSEDEHPLYRYDVELVVEEPAPRRCRAMSALASHPVTLLYDTNGAEDPVHGMAIDLAQTPQSGIDGVCLLRFAVVPRVWNLRKTSSRRTFHGLTVPEMVTRTLTEAGFSKDKDFLLRLNAVYPPRERVVQHERDDFDFLHALCKLEALDLSFAHSSGRDQLVISER